MAENYMYQNKKVGVIIAAAGSGTRMGGGISKQFRTVAGIPVIVRTAAAFDGHPYIDEIIVVTGADSIALCRDDLLSSRRFPKISSVTEGGAARQDSVYKGLLALPEDVELVLVHDAARPFVDAGIISRVVETAADRGAAAAAVPVKDTIKHAVRTDRQQWPAAGADCLGISDQTPDRAELFAAQTPQGFSVPLLRRAMEQAFADQFYGTDESALVERLGEKVYLVMGGYENMKITTPEDMVFACAIAGGEPGGGKPQMRLRTDFMRMGTGFDVHRLVSDRRLVLGGQEIPWEKGLLGHSDADVLIHAVMDALLGAAALGDIGQYFPDTDDAYKGISSLKLLQKVGALLRSAGYQIANIDAVVIAQKPKIAPYIPKMREAMAEALAVLPDQIGIKGTTTEGLGFCGRGEGIAAQATALIVRA